MSTINIFPDEILEYIISLLELVDILRCQVSQRLYKLSLEGLKKHMWIKHKLNIQDRNLITQLLKYAEPHRMDEIPGSEIYILLNEQLLVDTTKLIPVNFPHPLSQIYDDYLRKYAITCNCEVYSFSINYPDCTLDNVQLITVGVINMVLSYGYILMLKIDGTVMIYEKFNQCYDDYHLNFIKSISVIDDKVVKISTCYHMGYILMILTEHKQAYLLDKTFQLIPCTLPAGSVQNIYDNYLIDDDCNLYSLGNENEGTIQCTYSLNYGYFDKMYLHAEGICAFSTQHKLMTVNRDYILNTLLNTNYNIIDVQKECFRLCIYEKQGKEFLGIINFDGSMCNDERYVLHTE